MRVLATHKNARIAPRKVRPLARMLKGLSVAEARMQLQYLPGRAVRDVVLAVLQSAVANAEHNLGLSADVLKVVEVRVDGAFAMKRFRPASRGSAHPFVKRTSHVTVVVEGSPAAESEGKKGKSKRTAAQAAITTITADQYAAEALDDDQSEKSEPVPVPEAEAVEKDVPKTKEQQAFGKMRGLQGGGDKKKSFRRKSMG